MEMTDQNERALNGLENGKMRIGLKHDYVPSGKTLEEEFCDMFGVESVIEYHKINVVKLLKTYAYKNGSQDLKQAIEEIKAIEDLEYTSLENGYV